jgi:hypothetical protein
MKGGQDIRNWALSARKGLPLAENVTLLLKKAPSEQLVEANKKMGNKLPPKDEFQPFAAPKLAMVVTSSLLREYFEVNPAAVKVKIINERITAQALSILTEWMKTAITAYKLRDIIYPKDDFKAVLDLRVAAEALGMGQYVRHIVDGYRSTLYDRVPSHEEALTIINHRIGDEDALLFALDSRLAHLYRVSNKDQFSPRNKEVWDDALRHVEFQKIREAMAVADTRSQQKQQNTASETAL